MFAAAVGLGYLLVLAFLKVQGVIGEGINLLFSDAGVFLTGRFLGPSVRAILAMSIVVAVMAAMAKFTLTRRPRDYRKWV